MFTKDAIPGYGDVIKWRLVSRLTIESTHFVLEKSAKYIDFNLKDLQKKLDKIVLTLQEVEFERTSILHLQGLRSRLEKGLDLSTKRLVFSIDEEITDDYLVELIATLKTISQKSKKIEEVTLSSKLFTEAQIQRIKESNLEILINLPEQPSLQKSLDEVVSQTKILGRANRLTHKAPVKVVDPNKPKRYRTLQAASLDCVVDVDVMQEVEISVDHMMEEVQINSDSRNPRYSKSWNFSDFVNYLDTIPLKPGAGLLTFEEKQACWKSWVGEFENIKVSREAVMYLLNNRHIQPGLHIHHAKFLPNGLILSDYPPTLDYSLTYSSQMYRIAPTLTKTVQEPISFDLTKQIIEKLDENHPIKKIYKRLETEENYNRENWRFFRKHLPTLLLLDTNTLGHYYNGGGSLAFLDYVLENRENIQKLKKTRDIADFQAITNILKRDLAAIDSLRFLENISGIAEALSEKSPSKKPHILKQLLTKFSLSQDLAFWEKELKLTDEQLNGLLSVYSDYGSVGLVTLFSYWKTLPSDELKLLCTTLFKQGHSFSAMLDPKFGQALNSLQTLRRRKDGEALFQWWTQLLQQHCQTKGFDSLPALADAYVNFTRQIDKYGLSFYPNPQFSKTQCLPTTLASMLILLNDCPLGERKEQWKTITRMDLHPNRFKFCQKSAFTRTPEPQYMKKIPLHKETTLPQEILRRIYNQPQSLQPYLYTILNQFNAKSTEAESTLILLFNDLMEFQNRLSEPELVQFFSVLSSEFFLKSMDSNAFRLLLVELEKYEDLQLFYYFMDRAALIPNLDTKQFTSKARIYFNKREIYDDNLAALLTESFKNLKPLDVIHLSLDILFKFTENADNYWQKTKGVVKRIDNIVGKHPQLKEKVLKIIEHFFTSELSTSLIPVLTMFLGLQDSTIVNFICINFNNNPKDLAKLLAIFAGLDKDERNLGLRIWYLLESNNLPCIEAELSQLASLIKDKKDVLEQIYGSDSKPPYPTLDKAIQWVNNPNLNLKKEIDNFRLKPCKREERNGFQLEAAKNIHISGISFEDKQKLYQEVIKARKLTPDEISEKLKDARLKGTLSNEELLALAAELLHRIKGRPGNSYEINSTQYLELYKMLRENRLGAEIATGEGKSRIFAIAMACSYARGTSPNYATSNKILAYATYNEFKPYLESFAKRVVHIDENTAPEEYSDGKDFDVISISDTSSLQLFRNRAHVENKAKHVLHPELNKRALFLDEGDRVLYDLSDKRFNFSKKLDSLDANIWIYEQAVCFFEEVPQAKNLEISDCNQAFYVYCAEKMVGEYDKLDFLNNLDQGQLELWLSSAYNALNRVYETNFLTTHNKELLTPQGIKIKSDTYPVLSAHGDKAAKMSFGEQQCLHVRLNRLKYGVTVPTAEEKELVEELEKCKHDFYVDAESRIMYSSSSVSLLQDYPKESSLYILTGTIGSVAEQKEAKINNPGLEFVTFPRHQASLRKDKTANLAADREGKFELLLNEIENSIENNQPVQIFLENGRESNAFYKWLQAKAPKIKSTHITTDMHLETIEGHMKNMAGLPGHVTISTEMIGRGTHSVLHKESKQAGFKVLIAYLPSEERSLNQIKGRAARYGELGQTRIILDKKGLEMKLGKRFDEQAFAENPDNYLQVIQKILESKIQRERIVKDTVTLYRMDFTRHFYQCLSAETKAQARKDSQDEWAVFVRESDIAWNATWSQLRTVLHQEPFNINKVESLLNDYALLIQEQWKEKIEFPMDPFPKLSLSNEKKELLAEITSQKPNPIPIKVTVMPKNKIQPEPSVTPSKEISSSFLLDVFYDLSCGEILAYSLIGLLVLGSLAGLAVATCGVGAVAGMSAATVLGLSVTGIAVGGASMFAANTYHFFSNLKKALQDKPEEPRQLRIE